MEKVKAEYWEKKFQEMQSLDLTLEKENQGLKTKITELRRSLHLHQSCDSTVEDSKLLIEQLGVREYHLKGELHQFRGQVRERDHVIEEAVAQIREVAEHV
ncbi:hypothetical protein PVK06_017820 [Gossypium arboreum]|uniref:Uncharacterized protein n=1 Tax=Gossypium arboreum TaxID=29729 RepID=A0ABR0Q434_GOSAR|nr:hypothetical protein PVK06_017820 [Gossypium arboreum]